MLAVEVWTARTAPLDLRLRSFCIDRTNRLNAQSPPSARRRADASRRPSRAERPRSTPDRARARGARGAVVQRRRVIRVKIHPLASLLGAAGGRRPVHTRERDPSLRLPAQARSRELLSRTAGFGARGLAHGSGASGL